MFNILHDLPIKAPIDRAFQSVATPQGLEAWWTKRSKGQPSLGAEYELWFGPEYDWRARVTRCTPNSEFELEMTRADKDWTGTRVGFSMESRGDVTWLRFRHTGWAAVNEHFRVSSCCWAAYLRILRRFLECGEQVAYENRLHV